MIDRRGRWKVLGLGLGRFMSEQGAMEYPSANSTEYVTSLASERVKLYKTGICSPGA